MDETKQEMETPKVTRRSKSWQQPNKKNLVDNGDDNSIDLIRGEVHDKAAAHNSEGGITINPDVWDEMCTVGRFLCLVQDDPDFYDFFDWMRINMFGGQPYGDGLLARVDAEIAKELGPWNTT